MKCVEKQLQKDEKIERLAKFSLFQPFKFFVLLIIWLIPLFIDLIDTATIATYMNAYEGIKIFFITYFILSIYIIPRLIVQIICMIILYFTTELVVTNKRVIGKTGIFNIKILDTPIKKVNNVMTKTTFFGRIFKYSTIFIQTSSNYYCFKFVENAERVKNQITTKDDEVVIANIDKLNSSDKYEQLSKLNNLLKDDVITKEEFEAEKKKLLDK